MFIAHAQVADIIKEKSQDTVEEDEAIFFDQTDDYEEQEPELDGASTSSCEQATTSPSSSTSCPSTGVTAAVVPCVSQLLAVAKANPNDPLINVSLVGLKVMER